MGLWSLFRRKPPPPSTPARYFAGCATPYVMALERALPPDPDVPDTLGWRCWRWDEQRGRLVSPIRGTVWEGPELHADNWSDEAGLRGLAGVHARLVPHDWRSAEPPDDDIPPDAGEVVTGIVERFGRYVLGTLGWRAEWVVIRELQADEALFGKLARAYPEARINGLEKVC